MFARVLARIPLLAGRTNALPPVQPGSLPKPHLLAALPQVFPLSRRPPRQTRMDELDALIAEAEEDEPQPSPSPPPSSPPRRAAAPAAPAAAVVPRALLKAPAFTPLTPESYLPSLNENQRKAVEHSPDGGLQILAGPGSGPFVVLVLFDGLIADCR